MNKHTLLTSIINTACKITNQGLSAGRSGNISMRHGAGMFITPTGIASSQLTPSDIVFVDDQGRWSDAGLKPSSEWHFHHAVYQKRPDAQCIIHTHSPMATSLACALMPIPAFHYMVAGLGGREIPCCGYELFGSQALAEEIIATIGTQYHGCLMGGHGCLMGGHGTIAFANNASMAFERAELIEELAGMYVRLKQLNPNPPLLSHQQMDEVLAKFAGYGQQSHAKV